jgi:hypothetical protein
MGELKIEIKDNYKIFVNGNEKRYLYFYHLDENDEKDKERGKQRYAVGGLMIDKNNINVEKIKLLNWFEILTYWRKIDKDVEVIYNECRHMTGKLNENKINVLKTKRKSSREQYELLLLKQVNLTSKHIEFVGYKWSELKDVNFYKRILYIYDLRSSTKEKIFFTAIGLIGGFISAYLLKN